MLCVDDSYVFFEAQTCAQSDNTLRLADIVHKGSHYSRSGGVAVDVERSTQRL